MFTSTVLVTSNIYYYKNYKLYRCVANTFHSFSETMEEERAARVMSSLIRVMGSRITSTIYFTVWLDLRPFSWRASARVVVELHVAPPRGGRLNAEHGALLVAPARDLVEEHELLHVARGRDPPRQVGLPYTQRKTGSEPVLPVPASTRSKLGVLTIRAGHATFF